MFDFYFVLFCWEGHVFVSLLGGDDQSKCKWVLGKNLNHYSCSLQTL